MKQTRITRTDPKIRQMFTVVGQRGSILAKGQIYEQRNVMLLWRKGVGGCAEQDSTIDALLQSLSSIRKIVFE